MSCLSYCGPQEQTYKISAHRSMEHDTIQTDILQALAQQRTHARYLARTGIQNAARYSTPVTKTTKK